MVENTYGETNRFSLISIPSTHDYLMRLLHVLLNTLYGILLKSL